MCVLSLLLLAYSLFLVFFFFNDTATTEIYTLSLHDALPILGRQIRGHCPELATGLGRGGAVLCLPRRGASAVVHDQRHRGPELETPTRGPGPGPFPDRRGSP